MNLAFAGKGKFDQTTDTKIQFYLLKDSLGCNNGLPSNGIKRANIYDLSYPYLQQYFIDGIRPSTKEYFDAELQRLSPNPPTIRCLNIRLIPRFFEQAGFVTSGGLEDVILWPDATMNEINIAVLTHEIGHVFGLVHTFYGDYDNCIDGDGLSDTPIHKKSDIEGPEEINSCTDEVKGIGIFNFMSYSFRNPHFTKMQTEVMRELLSFYYPEFIDLSNPYVPKTVLNAPDYVGEPINNCTFTSSQFSSNYKNGISFQLKDLKFQLPHVNYSAFNDYTCSVKVELNENEHYTFGFEDDNSSLHFAAYIDFNDDGDFNDANETLLNSSYASSSKIIGFNVPASANKNNWLRFRLIRSSTPILNPCSINGYGSAYDFSVKVLPNCTKPNPPQVFNASVESGGSINLSANGCTGELKWYENGAFMNSGNNILINNISEDKTFYSTCTINDCESVSTPLHINVNPAITISNIPNEGYCANSQISIGISSQLKNGAFYSVSLKKGDYLIANKVFMKKGSTSYDFSIPKTFVIPSLNFPANLAYSNDYFFEIETFDLKTGKNAKITSQNFEVGAFGGSYNGIVRHREESFDINNLGSSVDYICPGKSKWVYGQAITQNNTITKENITYTWKKDGNIIAVTSSDSLLVQSPGSYSLELRQAGCLGNSNYRPYNLVNSSTIQNETRFVGLDYTCVGNSKQLFSNYQSTSANYQWKKDGVSLANSNNTTYLASENGSYSVSVQESSCNIIEAEPKRISFLDGLPNHIFSVTGDSTICHYENMFGFSQSSNMRLEDKFGGGLMTPSPFKFQWQLNNQNISGKNDNFIDIGYSGFPIASYRLIKSLKNCQSISNDLVIKESNQNPKPTVYDLGTLDICEGSIYIRTPLLQYSTLYKDGISQSSGNYFMINSSGTYVVKTSPGSVCENESDPFHVEIGTSFSPKIKFDDKTTLCGSSDYLGLFFSGTFDPTNTFQWYKDGTPVNGAIGHHLYVSQPGTYKVFVTSKGCSSFSNELTVSSGALQISTLDFSLGCSNRVSKIELSEKNGTLNVTWLKNGTPFISSNERSIFIAEEGTFKVQYNDNNGCSGETNSVTISKGGGNISASDIQIPKGTSGSLLAQGCNGGTPRWYPNSYSNSLLKTGPTFDTPGITQETSFFLNCYKNGCENLARKMIKVGVLPCLTNQNITPDNLNYGTYLASENLTSTTNVPTETIYKAGKSILLSPGFTAGENETFEAKIEGCEN